MPTQIPHRCRSTCQRTPSKTLRPTAVACAAGHTPQWVNRRLSVWWVSDFPSVPPDRCFVLMVLLIRWWPLVTGRLTWPKTNQVSCFWFKIIFFPLFKHTQNTFFFFVFFFRSIYFNVFLKIISVSSRWSQCSLSYVLLNRLDECFLTLCHWGERV